MTLAPDSVRTMFDRIAPVYDVMNRVMTAGLDVRWRRLTASAAVRAGDRVLDAACGTGDLAIADLKAGAGKVTGLDFSERMLERARRKDTRIEWVQGDMLALPFADATFDAATVGFGVRNVADLPLALSELRRVLRPGGRLAILEITQPRGALKPFFSLWFDRVVPLLGKVLPGGSAYTYLPASVKRFPIGGRARGAAARERLRRRAVHAAGGDDRRAPHRDGRVSALAQVHATPGLAGYMAEVETGLARAVAARPGLAQEVAGEALAAGGKRLRPLLCFLTAPGEPSRARGRRGRDGAHGDARARRPRRRRAAAARAARGVVGLRRRRGEGRGRLPLRVRVPACSRTPATSAPSRRSPTPRSASRAARRCRSCRRTTPTRRRRVPRALRAQDGEADRGRLPARLRRRRAARRVRRQPRHRVPDRRRHPRLRGPDAGDREDPRHRPARGHADDAAAARGRAGRRRCARRSPAARSTARSCASPRPTRSRARAMPRSTTLRARASFLGDVPHREELEALTYAVVDRARMIKLGRIGYVNMAPVFFRLDAEVEEVVGVPTELNRKLDRGRARRRADLVDRVRAQRGRRCGCCRASASRAKARSSRSS